MVMSGLQWASRNQLVLAGHWLWTNGWTLLRVIWYLVSEAIQYAYKQGMLYGHHGALKLVTGSHSNILFLPVMSVRITLMWISGSAEVSWGREWSPECEGKLDMAAAELLVVWLSNSRWVMDIGAGWDTVGVVAVELAELAESIIAWFSTILSISACSSSLNIVGG